MSSVNSVNIAEFSLSCCKLRNKDWLSKSDPFVVLFIQPRNLDDKDAISEYKKFKDEYLPEPRSGLPERISSANISVDAEWHYAGETEVVWDELSPSFVSKFRCPTSLVPRLAARFEIYDMDDYESPLAKQDFLGSFESSLRELVSARNSVHGLADKRGKVKQATGTMRICVDKFDLLAQQDAANITLRVVFDPNSGINPGTKVFFVLSRAGPIPAPVHFSNLSNRQLNTNPDDDAGSGWIQLHRSGALSAPGTKREWTFQDALLREDVLLAGDKTRFLRLELFLHKTNGKHQRIGGTSSFTIAMCRDGKFADKQRLVPDGASGAHLRAANYRVETAAVASTSPTAARTVSDTVFRLSPTNVLGNEAATSASSLVPLGSVGSNITQTELVVRFGMFFWYPAAKKDSLLRNLSSRNSIR